MLDKSFHYIMIYEFLNINELNYGLETDNQMNAINTSVFLDRDFQLEPNNIVNM